MYGQGLSAWINVVFRPYSYKKTYILEIDNPDRGNHFINLLGRSFVSFIFVFLGVGLMFQKVFLPVAVSYASVDDKAPIITPVVDNSVKLSVKREESEDFVFSELSSTEQSEVGGIYYNTETEGDGVLAPEYFYITIPKLEIYDAKIATNSLELDPKEALGHFKGSCLPDESCNTFIFGHSTFKNVKNNYEKGDYKAVFSRLGELEYGDEFYINYNDKEYRYMVDFSKIDEPQNVDPLENPYPRSFHINSVTLFTCTPSGTDKYRLSVVGKLVD